MKSKGQLEAILATQIKEAGLPEPERAFRFHPVKGWLVSFAFTDSAIICDVVPGNNRGWRVRGRGDDGDCEKQNAAVLAGWLYLRVTSMMIEDGRALRYIKRALKEWG